MEDDRRMPKPKKKYQTSILDASESFWLGYIDWERATKDVHNGKAKLISFYDGTNVPRVISKNIEPQYTWYSPTLNSLYEHYDRKCCYCGIETHMYPFIFREGLLDDAATKDHVIPKSK